MKTLIGKGFNLPLRSGPRGLLDMVTEADLIDASIAAILTTRKGERWMNPTFGANLWRLVFEPRDIVFESLAYHYITDALEENEPRINVLGITFFYKADSPSRVDIAIKYRVKATNDIRNRVFPFFRAIGGQTA